MPWFAPFTKREVVARVEPTLEGPAPIERIQKRDPIVRAPGEINKRFAAGLIDDLTFSFEGVVAPINERLRHALQRMRARSRQVCDDNDYGRRFLSLVRSNWIGVDGLKLQMRATRDDGITLDTEDNRTIERAWRKWGKPANCSHDRKLSWLDIEKLTATSIARDGEVLLHLIETPGADFGLRIRVIPAEYLSESRNGDLPNGNRVVMGIEYSDSGLVVAYHLEKNKVRSWVNVFPEKEYKIIPAADIVHLHVTEYADQARGYPWMHSALRRLHMAGKYEEAELLAAYMGACKTGAIQEEEADTANIGDVYQGRSDGGDDADGDHERIEKLEPGMVYRFPKGVKFDQFDPTHPTSAFDGFMKFILQGASMGLNVANHALTGNLSDVNFSSIRAGVLEDRDQWRMLQVWLVAQMHERIFDRWLALAILNGRLNVPMRKVDTKYNDRRWQSRGWPGIDPWKESQTADTDLQNQLTTRSDILSERGKDFEVVVQQLGQEKLMIEAAGLTVKEFDSKLIASGASKNDDDE